jgi:opacity protein-like surface antigen
VSEPLFAAESETPAPTERAAPAAERAPAPAAERAPAQERARPARQRTTQTQPRQQTSGQSVQQTWTGAQVGGFGGGNAGGAGFADPYCDQGHQGFFSFQNFPGTSPVVCQSLNGSQPPLKFNSGTGGGTVGYGFAIPFPTSYNSLRGIYIGAEGMFSANNVNNTYTLNQTYPGQFATPILGGESITDTRTATTHIGSSVSVLARLGVLVTDKTLVYFSAGSATAKVSGTFTSTAIATISGPPASSILTANTSVSQTVTGYVMGGGVEIAYMPGVKIRLQYLKTQFPDVTFTVPLNVACSSPGPCVSGAETSKITPSFSQVTVGVGLGF